VREEGRLPQVRVQGHTQDKELDRHRLRMDKYECLVGGLALKFREANDDLRLETYTYTGYSARAYT
jgi:hypothetical protein